MAGDAQHFTVSDGAPASMQRAASVVCLPRPFTGPATGAVYRCATGLAVAVARAVAQAFTAFAAFFDGGCLIPTFLRYLVRELNLWATTRVPLRLLLRHPMMIGDPACRNKSANLTRGGTRSVIIASRFFRYGAIRSSICLITIGCH